MDGVDWNISIHVPLAGNDVECCRAYGTSYISIHVPLAGNDLSAKLRIVDFENFNPRSPRGERRGRRVQHVGTSTFQSTFPSRGTTGDLYVYAYSVEIFQSTFPSRGTTFAQFSFISNIRNFNPRSPRGERQAAPMILSSPAIFQSTFPSRGTTGIFSRFRSADCISIHVPLAGNDPPRGRGRQATVHFNPRSPRGERHNFWKFCRYPIPFQSTFPSRGTTNNRVIGFWIESISIHVPLAGNDLMSDNGWRALWNFNPRSPRGERRGSEPITR